MSKFDKSKPKYFRDLNNIHGHKTSMKKLIHIKQIIAITLLLVGCRSACLALATPEQLVVGEGFTESLGFHDATPTFSWKLPVGVKNQTAYRIEVKSETPLWDSGWVESDQSVLVPYGGEPLISRQRVEWRVMFRDEKAMESGWSKSAHFEMGLLSAADWEAQWIRPAPETSSSSEFILVKAVYRSRVNPEIQKDVTAFVQEMIKDNMLTVTVSSAALGGDAAPGQGKELMIVYQVDGKVATRIVNEGKTGDFPSADTTEWVTFLRREFPVSGNIERARLYVTARGLFEIKLNGKKVGNDYFANGWTAYVNRLDTLTYDVTAELQSGTNKIDAMLGTGWYAGSIGWRHRKGAFMRRPELLVQLEVTSTDGTVQTLVSDDQWQGTFVGPVISSSIYHGEHYDARREVTSWGPVTANPELGSARLIPKPFAPVRATELLSVKEITEPEPGHFVFDLGQNMVGWPRIRIPVEKDQTTTIRFAEMLKQDGTIYTANYRSAKSTNSYTAAETGTIEWEPVFTYHGFRYVQLTGLPEGIKPQKDWVTGVVLHSDLPRIGKFESSHAKLNQLQSNITWGQRGNFLDIPSDCPQRDERQGWTGDAQVFCPTSMFNYDSHAFWKSWLGSMRDDQMTDGRIPHIIPSPLQKGGGSPGWLDAATIIPWEVYVRTGDIEVLAENFDMMERLVGWYRSKSKEGLIPKIGGFGDWLQPYAETRFGETPQPLIGTAFYANSVKILSDSARVLDRTSDATTYAAEAAAVALAFGTHYFDADGKIQNAPETQTAYILALEFGLVPVGMEDQAAAHLLRLIDDADGHLRTGFLGTPFINRVLQRAGYPDLAFSILFKETYPSWFFSINQGATTMWERWNSYSHKDGFGAASMNSFNHYAYGAIGQWMYERIAGLAPDPAQPGYKHILIQPLIGGPLEWASAELETSYGLAKSKWTKTDGKLTMDVIVPPNTTATVVFPEHRGEVTWVEGKTESKSKTDAKNRTVLELDAGTHQFELNLPHIENSGVQKPEARKVIPAIQGGKTAFRVMKKHKIQVNDLHAFITPNLKEYALAADNVHFTNEGYNQLGKKVVESIKINL